MRLPLKDADEFVRTHIALVLGPFLLRELTFGRFGGQIFDPSLKLRVRPKTQDGFRFVRQNDYLMTLLKAEALKILAAPRQP